MARRAVQASLLAGALTGEAAGDALAFGVNMTDLSTTPDDQSAWRLAWGVNAAVAFVAWSSLIWWILCLLRKGAGASLGETLIRGE